MNPFNPIIIEQKTGNLNHSHKSSQTLPKIPPLSCCTVFPCYANRSNLKFFGNPSCDFVNTDVAPCLSAAEINNRLIML